MTHVGTDGGIVSPAAASAGKMVTAKGTSPSIDVRAILSGLTPRMIWLDADVDIKDASGDPLVVMDNSFGSASTNWTGYIHDDPDWQGVHASSHTSVPNQIGTARMKSYPSNAATDGPTKMQLTIPIRGYSVAWVDWLVDRSGSYHRWFRTSFVSNTHTNNVPNLYLGAVGTSDTRWSLRAACS